MCYDKNEKTIKDKGVVVNKSIGCENGPQNKDISENFRATQSQNETTEINKDSLNQQLLMDESNCPCKKTQDNKQSALTRIKKCFTDLNEHFDKYKADSQLEKDKTEEIKYWEDFLSTRCCEVCMEKWKPLLSKNIDEFEIYNGKINIFNATEYMLFGITGKLSVDFWCKEDIEFLNNLNESRKKIHTDIEQFALRSPLSKITEIKDRTTVANLYRKPLVKMATRYFDKEKARKLVDLGVDDFLATKISDILLFRKRLYFHKLGLHFEVPEVRCSGHKINNKFTVIYTSIQGFNHIENKKECEDYSGTNTHSGYKFAYVADGVSSAEYSKIGSKATGEAILELINRLSSNKLSLDDFPNQILQLWKEAVNMECDKNAALKKSGTKDEKSYYSQFSTTLLAVIKDKEYTYCFRIGNGLFVICQDEEFSSWTELENKNVGIGGEICLHHLENNINYASFKRFKNELVKHILLATDGAEPGLMNVLDSNGIPLASNIFGVYKFIENFANSKKHILDKEKELENLAKKFAIGASYQGATYDDSSICYIDLR